jgi:hypothetical protein
MSDTTIKKVEAASSPKGEMDQRYLVAGKRISMRLWDLEPGSGVKHSTSRDYETVGYVISGSAKFELEGKLFFSRQAILDWSLRSDPPIHDHRTLQSNRGDRTASRSSRS